MGKRRAEISVGGALIYSLGRNTWPAGTAFSNSGGGFGGSGGRYGTNFGPVLFQDTFQNAAATTDLVAGRDVVKWPSASYLSGAAPNIQYDGTGLIKGVAGAGPPAVRMYSQAIVLNAQKPYQLTWENCGLVNLGGGQQASMAFGMDCDVTPALGIINYSWNGGLTGVNTAVNFTLNLDGSLITLTGAQYYAAAGATLKVTSDQWNGTTRRIQTFFNGTLIDSRTTPTMPTGTQNHLRFVWGCAQVAGVAPWIIAGTITLRGFST